MIVIKFLNLFMITMVIKKNKNKNNNHDDNIRRDAAIGVAR